MNIRVPEFLHKAVHFFKQVGRITNPWAWGILIFLLPITSLPFLIALVHSDMVGSASAVPLLWLFIFFLVPYVIKHGAFPRVTLPMIAFVLAALVSSAGAYFLDLPAYKGLTIISREIRALFTLGVGISFYLVASTWPDSPQKIKITFRVLDYTGLLIILWSGLQFYLWYRGGGYPSWLNEFQAKYINMRGFFADRATGFTLEPSWLAHQLNMIYLPYWLAATMTGYTSHRFRVLWISLENVLLLGGIATLAMSQSRVGMVAFFLAVAFLAIRINVYLARWLSNRLASIWTILGSRGFKWSLTALILLIFAAGYTVGLYNVAKVWARYDRRVAHLFETPNQSIFSIKYANQLGFAERVVFWAVGWEVFSDYPIIGVGLGNAGFFFQDKMQAFGFALPEVNQLIYYVNHIPNTKSLWPRLLSETGLVGMVLFLTWMIVLWFGASFLRHQPERQFRAVGLMGGLVLVALLLEGFSVDTFALPYWWISLGLVSAVTRMAYPGRSTK